MPSPLRHPEKVDVVIFRENTEDVYAGIEYKSGTPENEKVARFLREEMGARFFEGAGIGIKPISAFGTKRLMRKAIQYAMDIGKKDDIIVLAGKGHETYQDIGGHKYHLDEREEVAAHLAETRN